MSGTRSNFTGVFTLKTQAEATELATAVITLVERGVNIFAEINQGTSGEIESTLKTVVRLSHSFEDLTLDEAEAAQCRQVIDGLTKAEAAIQGVFQVARRQTLGAAASSGEAEDRQQRERQIAGHMQAFLASLADLCDMMEENQNKRGIMIIKQAVLHLQSLRDPRYTDFEGKLKHFESSGDMVVKYLANRESVADDGSPLKRKLLVLGQRTVQAIPPVVDAVRKRHHATSDDPQLEEREKAAVVEMVGCLKEAGDIFSVKEGRVKTTFSFTYEKVEGALNTLSQAVQSGSRAEATAQARLIVDALKQQQEAHPRDAIKLRAASVQLVSATKEALDKPSEAHAKELDRVAESVKNQFSALASPVPLLKLPQESALKMELMKASANLSGCLSELTSPRSPRSPAPGRFPSPRSPAPGRFPSPRAPFPGQP